MSNVKQSLGGSKPPKGKANKKKIKKSGGHGRAPLQIFASGSGFTDIESDKIDSSIIYQKSATGAFDIKLSDIEVRNKNPKSYDIHLIMPGYGSLSSDRGRMTDLMGSTFILYNPSPFSLTIRMQRPMGYKEDPSSIGMWEPLGGKLIHELAPKGSLKLGNGNQATLLMEPRQTTVKLKRCVHVCSLSVYREPLSNYGTELAKAPTAAQLEEIGLQVEVETRYKSVNGDIGQNECYIIHTFNGSSRLDYVVNGPLTSLRLADLTVPSGQVDTVKLQHDGTKKTVSLVFINGGKADTSDLPQGLAYNIDYAIVGKADGKSAVSQSIALVGGKWIYGMLNKKANDAGAFRDLQVDTTSFIPDELSLQTVLRPMILVPQMNVKYRLKKGILAVQTHGVKMLTQAHHDNLEAGFFETILQGLVMVFEVTKVAVEILGVVGVLENPSLASTLRDKL